MDVIRAYIIVFLTGYIYNVKLRSGIENLYEMVESKMAAILKVKTLYNII